MSFHDRPADVDLGEGVLGWFYSWKPDRALNPQYAGIADIDRVGLFLEHKMPHDGSRHDGSRHDGSITFDLPGVREVFGPRPVWQVQAWEPLTLTPSVKCSCGWHGFITNGRWADC